MKYVETAAKNSSAVSPAKINFAYASCTSKSISQRTYLFSIDIYIEMKFSTNFLPFLIPGGGTGALEWPAPSIKFKKTYF